MVLGNFFSSRPTSTAPSSAYERLLAILINQQDLEEILACPGDALTPSQKDALHQIVQHFTAADVVESSSDSHEDEPGQSASSRDTSDENSSINRSPDPEPQEGSQGDGPSNGTTTQEAADPSQRSRKRRAREEPRGRKRARVSELNQVKPSSNPWQRIVNIGRNELKFPNALRQHIERHGTDPAKLLSDQDLLIHRIADFDHDSPGDAFMACYTYTLDLSHSQEVAAWRWLFSMLNFYDLVMLIRPEGSGRIGDLMYRDLQDLCGMVDKVPGERGDQARNRINEWSRQGRRLNQLCVEFGPGCLFFLTKYLTKDFLSTKYTATGDRHDQAIEHLRDLGMERLTRESQATELGQRIRDYLIEPFEHAMDI